MIATAGATPSTAPGSSNFALTKWYLDVVDEQGNVYIGYWLALRWREVQLQAYHHLLRTPHDGVKTYSGLRRQPPPIRRSDAQISWQPGNAIGLWSAAADPIGATLLSSEQGDIHWQCLLPKAKGRIELPQLSVSGWGYVECIDITLPVWALPFKHLYWGRCHTANHYLVWIQWTGATSKSLAWHNGRSFTDLVITDTLLHTSEFRLTIDQNIPLRHGQLISTVFKPLSAITKLLPRPAFMAHERKWLGHGRLQIQSTSELATIIYEELTW